jgi:hypothetical protein
MYVSGYAVICFPSAQVWKIEDFLTKWGKSVEGKGADDPVALILKQEVDTYR